MAVDKLSLYNNALTLLGQRTLTGLTEDREPRYILDGIYDLDAIKYCLEVVKPVFARKTVLLSSPVVSTEHDLDSVHTLPSDYITITGVYSDAKLDQPISRYIIEGNTLACEYASIYLRYTSDDHVTSFTNWSASFARVVAAYLGRESSSKLAPKQTEEINSLFLDRVESTIQIDKDREPENRSSVTTVTLTNDWRNIYNDALLIMGLDEITTNTDDSNRRTKLDRSLDAGIVAELLEITGWTFATTSTKSDFDPSIEPDWGYSRAHSYPADMHRIDGYFYDEYMKSPLKAYTDEGDKIFTDEDTIYVQYISTDWLVNPSNWPAHFKRLVAARMANDASASLRNEGADMVRSKESYDERESSSKSIDAMSSPPRRLASGRWASSRFNNSYRGRP